MSQFETHRPIRKLPAAGTLGLFLFISLLSAPGAVAQVANSDEKLRDSCHAYFKSVRDAEANVRTIESQSVRMVRLGGNPDTALYDRLQKVHQTKVNSAKVQLRQHESALSGCLANALRDKAKELAGNSSNGQSVQVKVASTPIPHREIRSPASQAIPVRSVVPVYTPSSNTPASGGGPTVR